MSFSSKIQQYLPFRKKPSLPRQESLALRPVRNRLVRWEPNLADENGGMRLMVPRRQDGIARLLTRWLSFPTEKVIELDEFGAAVWERCDSHHTVGQIVGHTCTTYKLNRRQAEVSVMAFLKMLGQRNLIGFAVPVAPAVNTVKEKDSYAHVPQRQRRPRRAAWRRH